MLTTAKKSPGVATRNPGVELPSGTSGKERRREHDDRGDGERGVVGEVLALFPSGGQAFPVGSARRIQLDVAWEGGGEENSVGG